MHVPTLTIAFWMTSMTTVLLTVLACVFEQDRWFMPDEAKAYGLIDHVYTSAADAPAAVKKSAKGAEK
jgi:ATP-dependent protease ClpP protease subunit